MGDRLVESLRVDRAFPGLEFAGDIGNEVACVMGGLGVAGELALDSAVMPWVAS